jgi:tRNA/tmRNA/rRNA uracil-C5-methylase (TrmA/RlmC/RlmD family)
MATILINISESERMAFQAKVGHRNMSPSIRQYIQSVIAVSDDISGILKQKKFEELRIKKEKLDSEFENIKKELKIIEQKKKEQELAEQEAFEKEKQKMADVKNDTLKANLHRMV